MPVTTDLVSGDGGMSRAHAARLDAVPPSPQAPQDRRRGEPDETAGAPRGKAADVDAADAALLERQRTARANQVGGKLAELGLMADQGDAATPRDLGEVRHDGGRGVTGRQRVEYLDRRLPFEPGGKELGRLLR